MPMTREQQLELRKMLSACSFYSYSTRADRLAKKKCPVTAEERQAEKLLARKAAQREAIKSKLEYKFNDMKKAAHESIYFSNDVKDALKKVHDLQNFCKG